MKFIGLTGSFGSGKTTVLEMFHKKGADIISADSLAKEAVIPGSSGYQKIVSHFGHSVVGEHGVLNRKAIAEIVFNDEKELAFLNQVTHLEIKILRQKYIEQLVETNQKPIIIYESPLLFETALESMFQAVVLVTVNEQARMDRLCRYRGFSHKEVKERLKNQMSQEEKQKRSDFEIDNSHDLKTTELQVFNIWNRIKQFPEICIKDLGL